MRKKLLIRPIAFGLLFLSVLPAAKAQSGLRLWYDKPASDRSSALPLGNGNLGALVTGNPLSESIALSEASVWTGMPGNNCKNNVKQKLTEIRGLVQKNPTNEATNLALNAVLSPSGASLQPTGNLIIRFPSHKKVTAYSRELNLSSGCASTRYSCNGVIFTRDYIVSLTDSVVLIRLKASKPKSISCDVQLSAAGGRGKLSDDGVGMLMLNGWATASKASDAGVRFAVRAKPLAKNGSCSVRNNVFSVQNADELLIVVSMASNVQSFNGLGLDETEKANRILNRAYGKDFDGLRSNHEKVYQAQFNRVSLDLGTSASSQKATDVRIREYQTKEDPSLAALLFQYGRYLMIASSQAGGQPANLTGLWGNETFNGQTDENAVNFYAPDGNGLSETTQLAGRQSPYWNLFKELSVTGRQAANGMYGARGWAVHQSTDVWRQSGATTHPAAGIWPLGGVAVCRSVWEHYLFTGDKAFLSENYPVLVDAARFMMDYLVRDSQTGCMVVSPGTEYDSKTSQTVLTVHSVREQVMARELFLSVIQATEVLNSGLKNLFGNSSTAFADSLKKCLPQLSPLPTDQNEYLPDGNNVSKAFSGVGSFYGVYPGAVVSPYRTPEVYAAASSGWSQQQALLTGGNLAWKMAVQARFLSGNKSLQLMKSWLNTSSSNLTGSGFRMNENWGLTAAVSEMLLQSHDGFVYLLPALPSVWKNGSVKGLCARGGFTFDLLWKNGRPDRVTVHSALGGNLRLRSVVPLVAKGIKPAKGDNPNPFFDQERVISKPSAEKESNTPFVLPDTFLYDLKTEPGQTLEISVAAK